MAGGLAGIGLAGSKCGRKMVLALEQIIAKNRGSDLIKVQNKYPSKAP